MRKTFPGLSYMKKAGFIFADTYSFFSIFKIFLQFCNTHLRKKIIINLKILKFLLKAAKY